MSRINIYISFSSNLTTIFSKWLLMTSFLFCSYLTFGNSLFENYLESFKQEIVNNLEECKAFEIPSSSKFSEDKTSLIPTVNIICTAGATEITGTIFEDYNYDGICDANETQRFENITVTATDNAGNSMSAVTNTAGTYSIPGLTAGTNYRVEFTNIPTWAQTSLSGTDNGTTVQFMVPGNCANLSLSDPAGYCQDNPFLMVPCYVKGDNTGTEDVVVRWSYNNSGLGPDDKVKISDANQTAALWGMAYDPASKLAYGSAVLKSHTGLHEGASGGGLDAIFTIDPFSPTNGTLWLELQDDLGIDVGQASVPNNAARGLASSPQYDEIVYPFVGTIGIGDIEISGDFQTLYVMNLFDKTLYEIDIATKTINNSYLVPDPGCTNGTYRPWAVAVQKGEVFVGSICDASSAGKSAMASDALTNTTGRNNLNAYVYRLDGGSFTEVLNFPLDYAKQPAHGTWGNHPLVDGWFPWTNDLPLMATGFNSGGNFQAYHSYPQPILSDIIFDDNNDMILGIADRM